MSAQPISIPAGETPRVRELQKVMQAGRASLVGPDGRRHEIPNGVYGLFLEVLRFLEEGKAISIVPYMQELTTQEAARFLGVSRQFFVRSLDSGALPHYRVGTHRRVYLKDLLEYRRIRDERRSAALDEIVEVSREAGLYDKGLAHHE